MEQPRDDAGAQLVDWNGDLVPPSVKHALETPWRGQTFGADMHVTCDGVLSGHSDAGTEHAASAGKRDTEKPCQSRQR